MTTQERLAGWEPIDTAPKDGTPILIYGDGKTGIATLKDQYSREITFRNDAHAWIGDNWGVGRISVWLGGDDPRKATHWMPLPPPPPAVVGEGETPTMKENDYER